MAPRALPWWKSKTVMIGAAVAVMVGLWLWSVAFLVTMPIAAIAAFQSITIACFTAVSATLMWGLGMKNIDKIMSFRTEVLSQATSVAQNIVEHREEKIEVIRTAKAEHFDGEDIE